MIPSTLCALLSVLSSLAASNGAVVKRDTTTFLSPQPTSATASTFGQTGSTSSTVTSTSVTTTSSATRPTTTSSFTFTSNGVTTIIPVSVAQSTTSSSTSSPVTFSATASGTIIPVTTTASGTVLSTTVTTTATSTPSPGTGNCDGIQQWQSAFAYVAGDRVIFNGQLFTAKQWTYNNDPPTHPDQWTAGGVCNQPVNNKANCNGVTAWQSTVAYTTGNRVTYKGHLWSAVQWTQANSPGDASGSWKDLGACA